MKKLAVIITTIACACLLVSSCDDNKTKTLIDPYDKSLAGSASIYGHRIVAEGSFDGDALDNFQYDASNLIISKESDTEVSLICVSKWGETTFKISIPIITLSGKPCDVTFDSSSDDTVVTYNNVEYTSVGTTVAGWIKSEDGIHYTCEIDIDCNMDSKILDIKITSIEP